MIISFAWTTPALLAGAKTMTRRDWSPSHAAHFKPGMLVDAWDRSPRTGKGRKVATIRITKAPWRQRTGLMTQADLDREGITWLKEHGYDAPPPYGGTALPRSAWNLWAGDWVASNETVYVVEFELVDVERTMRGVEG